MKKNTLFILFLLLLQLPMFKAAAAADWYVRLTVEAPDDPEPIRKNDGNVFGRLHDSLDGKDSHDLAEMPPPDGSMGDRYLSIVFPHPEWGGSYDGYSSDYRAPVEDEAQGDRWIFEVRTRTPGIRTVISWKEGLGNPFATLPYSRIRDAATNATVAKAMRSGWCAVDSDCVKK